MNRQEIEALLDELIKELKALRTGLTGGVLDMTDSLADQIRRRPFARHFLCNALGMEEKKLLDAIDSTSIVVGAGRNIVKTKTFDKVIAILEKVRNSPVILTAIDFWI